MRASVVITTKNRVDFLKRAILSIINNQASPHEIIVVNDGGITPDLDHFHLQDGMNLILINNPVSLGGNKARNQGVLAASGDIIFFLDDDDAYTSQAISEKMRVFEADHGIVLVYTGIQFVMSGQLNTVIRTKNPSLDYKLSFKEILANGNLVGPTSSVAVRKSAFISAGLFDEKLGAMQDYELWLRMVQQGAVKSDGGMNLLYTIHVSGAQISAKYEKYLAAAAFIADKFQNDLDKFDISRKFWAEIYFRVALSCSHASETLKLRFAIKSFFFKPSLKSLALLIPTPLLRKIKPFV
ncbi:glycosyltransferase family 2 protein [Aeromonas salmonicida]|uniref:glycosyltransferase family 2 protein n=1 Tax=Aeromonas salmonicida TaxID=645 RepID=UPI00370D275B